MKKKEIKKLYLVQGRYDKRYYTQEAELIKYVNRLKSSKYFIDNSRVFVFDLVGEFNPIDYVEGRELENTRDLKMRVLLENDPTAIKIEKLKGFLQDYPIKYGNSFLTQLNLIQDEKALKAWVVRSSRLIFSFGSGDSEIDLEWFKLILSIHNFNQSSLSPRYYQNSTLEQHPFYLAKKLKNKKSV